jgi:hypothetical protein
MHIFRKSRSRYTGLGDPEKAIALLREQIRPAERSGGMSEAEFKRRIIDRLSRACGNERHTPAGANGYVARKCRAGEQVARPALPAGALLLAPLQEFAEQRLAVGLALRRGARA